MESREDELARLIAEQAVDDRDFQPPEPGTVPYGLRLGDEPLFGGSRDKLNQGCTLHGNESLRVDRTRGTGWQCRICDRERKRRAVRTK